MDNELSRIATDCFGLIKTIDDSQPFENNPRPSVDHSKFKERQARGACRDIKNI